MRTWVVRMVRVVVAAAPGLVLAAGTGSNLVVNGSFDDPNDPLTGWKYKYDLPGESWYYQNHQHVSVTNDGSRKSVLTLWGDYAILQAPGQGTKVDSKPVAWDKGATYEFSLQGRSTGPMCRILVEAYKWAPGIKPHPDPELHELRKVYKFSQVYFGAKQEGTMSSVPKAWTRGSTSFPDPQMAKSEQAQKMLAQIKFMVIHAVAIGGSEGTVYLDDVSIKRVK